VIPDDSGGPQVGLPFWRIRAAVDGIPLDTFADYVRFCNLPRAVTRAME